MSDIVEKVKTFVAKLRDDDTQRLRERDPKLYKLMMFLAEEYKGNADEAVVALRNAALLVKGTSLLEVVLESFDEEEMCDHEECKAERERRKN